MRYVLQNIETGKYVAISGLESSYTNNLTLIQRFDTKAQAEANRCVENERIIDAYQEVFSS